MEKKLVVNPDQTPDKKLLDWLEQYFKQQHEINSQLLRGVKEFGKGLTLDDLQRIIEHRHIVKPVIKSSSNDWTIPILEAERKAHLAFFGQEFGLLMFAEKLKKIGPKKIAWWKRNFFEVHCPPPHVFKQGVNLPGMEIAIPDNYYRELANGNVFRDVNGELIKIDKAETEGVTVLIDTRLKPAYDSGVQMWKRDGIVGGVMKKLRKDGRITNYYSRNSRFNSSADHEMNFILQAAASALKVKSCRLETTTERIVIPQLYRHMPRKDDGKTNTSIWCDEFYRYRRDRFGGGNSDCGGLADVYADGAGYRWRSRSFRFLAVL